ncbi:MAG: glycoside hydrolase family 3 N-terminal domain-containing protein [Solirubrobacteraceae bacterium]
MRRLALLGALVVVLLGGGIYLLFIRGGDDTPVGEAGSRFGDERGSGSGGTLMDTLAGVLGARTERTSGGSDPAAPSESELLRAPQNSVAGLFLVGFSGTDSSAAFLRRLEERPFGGVLLDSKNYEGPSELSSLTEALLRTADQAGHPAPIIAARQEGGDFNAFGNLPPRAQVDIGNAGKGIAKSAQLAAQQLRALGVGMNLAPNADIAVAGGPGQGRAFSDQAREVASAVEASVAAYRDEKVVPVVGPFPGNGAASQNPALGPAPVGLSLDELRRSDITPFEAVATGPSAAPAIQMSNAIYNAFDSVTPATLLPEAVDELRDRLGFEGMIVSANLVATTATSGGSVGEAAIEALNAGVDLLVVPGGRSQQEEAFRAVVAAVRSGKIAPGRIVDALARIAKVRGLTKDSRNPLKPGE